MHGENAMAKETDDKGTEAKDDTEARAKTRAAVRAKASKTPTTVDQGEVAEATKDDRGKVKTEALSEVNDAQAARMMENAGIEAEPDAGTESQEENVTADISNVQKPGMEHLEPSTTPVSSFLETLKAIAAETHDYLTRSLATNSSFIAKLLAVTTFESALQIQLQHANTSCAGFLAFAAKMTQLRVELAQELFKPTDMAFARVRGGKE